MVALAVEPHEEYQCGAAVRGGGSCCLERFHSGHHSTVAFVCDGCGRTRRGRPAAHSRDGEYEDGLGFCFLCARGLL